MQVHIDPNTIKRIGTSNYDFNNRRIFINNYVWDEYGITVNWIEEHQRAYWWMPSNTRHAVEDQLQSIADAAVEAALMEWPIEPWELESPER
jgi:hypothetical protein